MSNEKVIPSTCLFFFLPEDFLGMLTLYFLCFRGLMSEEEMTALGFKSSYQTDALGRDLEFENIGKGKYDSKKEQQGFTGGLEP